MAYRGFFRRHKSGDKHAGYPRFKSRERYNSFTISACGGVSRGGKIHVSGVESLIRCRGLQPITGTIKQLTVIRRAGEWFARILVEDGISVPSMQPVRVATGIDIGLHAFVATSNGETVECPKHYRRLEAELRRAGKRVSRRIKGSGRRRRAVLALQKVHAKIADCRMDFTHKLSRRLVNENQLIVAEKLNIKGLARGRLAKSILDASWGTFLHYVGYKAERAGCRFIQVDPRTRRRCAVAAATSSPRS